MQIWRNASVGARPICFEHPLLVMCLFASVLIAQQINAFWSIPKTVSVMLNCKRFEFQKKEIPMDFPSVLYEDKGKYTKGKVMNKM